MYRFFSSVYESHAKNGDYEKALIGYELTLGNEILRLSNEELKLVCKSMVGNVDLNGIDSLPKAVFLCPKILLDLWVGERIELLYTAPVLKYCVRPKYPWWAKVRKLSGSVTVEYRVSKTGHAIDAKLIDADSRIFIKPAMEAINSCTYRPAMRYALPEKSNYMKLRYEFTL
jgi:TonB family protein